MKSAAICWPGIMSYFGRAIRPHLAGHYVFTGRISVQTAGANDAALFCACFRLCSYNSDKSYKDTFYYCFPPYYPTSCIHEQLVFQTAGTVGISSPVTALT